MINRTANGNMPGPEEFSSESPVARIGESLREANSPMNLLIPKARTRIGTWNVKTLYQTGKLNLVAQEMDKYGIKVLGLCETRWNG